MAFDVHDRIAGFEADGVCTAGFDGVEERRANTYRGWTQARGLATRRISERRITVDRSRFLHPLDCIL